MARAALLLALLPAASRAGAGSAPVAGPSAAPPGPAAEYSVEAGPGARELRVEASFAEVPPGGLVFDDGMGRFARDVELRAGKTWKAAGLDEDALAAGACRRPCRVRYRFLLDEAARASRDRTSAFEQGGALVASPAAWLVRPGRRGPGRFRLQVTTPAGLTFATGLFPAGRGGYEAALADLPEAPYSAFGPFENARVDVAGGEVEVALLPGDTGVDRAALMGWVERAAGDVAAYYGAFPVPRALVIVIPGGRRAVGYGTTMGNGGA